VARKNVKATSASAQRSPVVVVLIIAAVVALGAVGYALSANVGGNDMATGPVEVPGLNDPDTLRALARSVSRGSADATIKIIEFGDYQCPACRYFHDSVKPRLDVAYVDSGIAQFVFYDFPLSQIHPYAFLAARAAQCALDQGNEPFWKYHTKLYEDQPIWSTRSAPPARDFVSYAEELGMDAAAFEGCVRSDRHADVVTAGQRVGMNFNLLRTPSVFIQVGNAIPRVVDYSSVETLYTDIVAPIDSIQSGRTPPAG
jgi:protein-disulfide isomerase